MLSAAVVAAVVAWGLTRRHRSRNTLHSHGSFHVSHDSGMIELIPPAVAQSEVPEVPERTNSVLKYNDDGESLLATTLPGLMSPQPLWPHLSLYLLPTRFINSEHPEIVKAARDITEGCVTIRQAADAIRAWVAKHIEYSFQDKSDLASDTLRKRLGMCTNKATLQIALLRALGIPAGYCVVHIYKTVYKDVTLPEMYKLVSTVTVHVFCSVFIPEENRFLKYDATGPAARDTIPLMVTLDTNETQMHPQWLAGPFGHVQANIDHLLQVPSRGKLSPSLIQRQNDLFHELMQRPDTPDKKRRVRVIQTPDTTR